MIRSRRLLSSNGDLNRRLKIQSETENEPLDEVRQPQAMRIVVESERVVCHIRTAKGGRIQVREKHTDSFMQLW